MKLIRQEKLDRKITEKYSYDFTLIADGLYLIEITASAKNWYDNLKSFKSLFKDDDLALTLDRLEITASRSNQTDVRAAWNGNELKGLTKTVVMAVKLKPGQHVLNFIPDQSPYLKSIIISQVEETNTLTYIPTNNNPAEKGDRRPWLSFILINLAVKDITILAKADKRSRDDDDIKLIIDGETEKNQDQNSHQDWYWCGKVLKGETKEFKKTVNFTGGLHMIDLRVDERPFLHKIELALNETADRNQRISTVDNPEWTGDFKDDSDGIILARLIFGEANGQPYEAKVWVAWSVINRMEAKSWWPHTIKEIILQDGQYDPFKPLDPNYKKIINPLNFKGVTEIDKSSWNECYQIAQDVVLRKTTKSTTATHFFGKGVSKKWFERNIVPNGKFLKKIGDTYFYWSPN